MSTSRRNRHDRAGAPPHLTEAASGLWEPLRSLDASAPDTGTLYPAMGELLQEIYVREAEAARSWPG
jgi:hypothetical protein